MKKSQRVQHTRSAGAAAVEHPVSHVVPGGVAATRPVFQRFLEFLEHSERTAALVVRGVRGIEKLPPLAKALHSLDSKAVLRDDEKRTLDLRLTQAEEAARFAREEIANDFPFLRSALAILLWGALEAAVDDVVVEWLRVDPRSMMARGLSGIRVPLAKFQAGTDEERIRLLLAEVIRRKRAEFKPGIGRFEAILQVAGLSGEFDAARKRDLLELSKVRNLLVHRAGVVDRRFLDDCPWIDVRLGSTLRVSGDRSHAYATAASEYALELVQRVRVRSGLNRWIAPDEPHSTQASARGRTALEDAGSAAEPAAGPAHTATPAREVTPDRGSARATKATADERTDPPES